MEHERKRLYHEAVDFMKLRADRKKVARKGRAEESHGLRAGWIRVPAWK